MMEITNELIDHLAHLARLQFTIEEKKELQKDLQRMIEFVEKLKEINTDGIEPMLHMSDAVNVFREDEVRGSVSREEALRNAPVKDNEYFKVPKVIKK